MKRFQVLYDVGNTFNTEAVYARTWEVTERGVLMFFDDTSRRVRAYRSWIKVYEQ